MKTFFLSVALILTSSHLMAATIDRIDTFSPGEYSGFSSESIYLLGSPKDFSMSDGSMWFAGAGGGAEAAATLSRAQVENGKVSYTFNSLEGTWGQASNILLAFATLGINQYQSAAVLSFSESPVFVADLGAKDAYWSGYASIDENSPGPWGIDGFQYLSSPVGSEAYFTADLHNLYGTFDATTFSSGFLAYTVSGEIQFAQIPESPMNALIFSILVVSGAIGFGWRRSNRCEN